MKNFACDNEIQTERGQKLFCFIKKKPLTLSFFTHIFLFHHISGESVCSGGDFETNNNHSHLSLGKHFHFIHIFCCF